MTLEAIELVHGRTSVSAPGLSEALEVLSERTVDLTAPTVELAQYVGLIADVRDALNGLDGAARAELARRLDADNTRKAPVVDQEGEVIGELEVNAPDSEEYDVAALRDALHPLIADGVLTLEALERATPYPTPKPPARRVDKRELAKLKKHPDRRVAQAIGRVRRIVPTSRKVKVTLTDA